MALKKMGGWFAKLGKQLLGATLFWYIIKRILAAIGTLLVIMVLTFILMRVVPGNPFKDEKIPQATLEQKMEKYGLNKPLFEQFKDMFKNYLHGDMGLAMVKQEGTEVSHVIFGEGKFEISIKLGLCGLILAFIVGVPLGCIAAYKRGTWLDGLLRVMTTVGVAIPTFVIATLLLNYCAVRWIFPTKSGQLTDFASYVLPVITLSSYYVCYVAKLTRTSMLDAINQDYIRTARAKGVKTGKLILKHALRNSLIPVVTYMGPVTAGILTGSFVVETTFQIPGLGAYFIRGIQDRDYNIIMATTMVLAALVIFMNLIVDVVYCLIDPRISLATKED